MAATLTLATSAFAAGDDPLHPAEGPIGRRRFVAMTHQGLFLEFHGDSSHPFFIWSASGILNGNFSDATPADQPLREHSHGRHPHDEAV